MAFDGTHVARQGAADGPGVAVQLPGHGKPGQSVPLRSTGDRLLSHSELQGLSLDAVRRRLENTTKK